MQAARADTQRPAALREAMRGTSDPTYLVYTLGKLEIYQLREDYRKALAGPFSPELQRMRDLVQAGRVIQDPEAWARVASEELLALKGVQDRMSRDLLADAQGLERGARTKGWFLAAGFSAAADRLPDFFKNELGPVQAYA